MPDEISEIEVVDPPVKNQEVNAQGNEVLSDVADSQSSAPHPLTDTPTNHPSDHDKDTKNKGGHDDHKKNIIIIKKVKKVIHKSHGGAWKIAYADFVTAMMTFFLLMWLLSMLNKYQLEGISEYFKNPRKTITKQNIDPKLDKVKNEKTTTTDKLTPPKAAPENDDVEKDMNEKEKKLRAASEAMKKDLQDQLKSDPKLSQYENALNFVVTSQGLKIELKDLENQVMFTSGKTDFGNYAKEVLTWLGQAMNKYPNRVMIVGHTDSKPFPGEDGYSNWELSADRANATRRELIDSGMKPEKIVRIVGAAATDKLETAKSSDDPANRRISIVVLTDEAFNKMQDE